MLGFMPVSDSHWVYWITTTDELCCGVLLLRMHTAHTHTYHTHTHTQSTGIVAMLMIFTSCLCCGSFWGLFCGDFHRLIKMMSVVGFLITGTSYVILLLWLVLGTYLLIMMGGEALLESVCRNLVIYLVFMYIFAFVFFGATVIACVWQCHSAVEDHHARFRRKA